MAGVVEACMYGGPGWRTSVKYCVLYSSVIELRSTRQATVSEVISSRQVASVALRPLN